MQEYLLLLYIGLISFIGFIAFKYSDPLIDYLDKLSVKVANYIIKKIKHRYLVLLIDIIFILTILIPIIFFREYLNFIKYPYIYSLILFLMRFEGNLRKTILLNSPNKISLITFIKSKLEKRKYLYPRFMMISEQILGFLVIYASFYFTVVITTLFPKPEYIFLIYLFIPITLSFWVYLTPSFKFQDEKILKTRKLITYCFLVILAFIDIYIKITVEVLNDQPIIIKESLLLLSTIVIIYIPLDRLLNLWREDLNNFNNPKKDLF